MATKILRKDGLRLRLDCFHGVDFEDQEEVGWGFSGLVLKSLHLPTNQILARKIIHETPRKRIELAGNSGRELEFYEKLGEEECRNVVKCFGRMPVGGKGHIHGGLVFEFMDQGSLADFLTATKHNPLPEPIILHIAQNLLKACAQLESMSIVHRDIKPSNILFDSEGGVKLCDFGEACYRWESEDEESGGGRMAGSTAYMSPERLASKPHSHPADIWSIGLVLLELTCPTFPFDNTSASKSTSESESTSEDYDHFSSISNSFEGDCSIIELWEMVMETDPLPKVSQDSYSPDLALLVDLCMRRNPLERPTAKELLNRFSSSLNAVDPQIFVNYLINTKSVSVRS